MINQRKLTKILFGFYFLLLVWAVLFKLQWAIEDLPNFRSLNLVPLEGTAIIDAHYDYMEIGLNIAIFFPFGHFLSQIKPHWHLLIRILVITLTSIFFEMCQYVFVIGGTDITDVIANTLGGILGIVLYVLVKKLWREKAGSVLNFIGIVEILLGLYVGFILKPL